MSMKKGQARNVSGAGIAAIAMLSILTLAGVSTVLGAAGSSSPSPDPLAAEIERWSAFLRSDAAAKGVWPQLKAGEQPLLAHAAQDLSHGRRLLALHRLALARTDLAIGTYLSQLSAAQHQEAGFEAEWARMGKVLHADMGPPSPTALAGVQPAALRALGEAAIPQVRAYYVASLDYGRSTMPDDGLYYLGTAQAQRDFVELCRRLSVPQSLRQPPLRPLRTEIESLQSDLLKAYRPPASVDRHGAFITANATLKEARELDAAGLRYGALLRYLDAAQLVAPLRPAAPPLAPAELRKRLAEFSTRLSAGGIDHSIGRMILEGAQDEVANAAPGASPAASTMIASDVLPRYFAALSPARPEPPRLQPQVTVTLVRWPYT
jgi:hypothetical protein